MLILVYDTETTGLLRGADYTNPNAPFLASIAMLLYDTEKQRVISSFNTAIKPDGWVMPEEAMTVNGLTIEYLNEVGIPLNAAMPVIMHLSYKATLRVAHNVDFDNNIIAAALWRYFLDKEKENEAHTAINKWLSVNNYCTMKESKELVGALNKRGQVKYPRLDETYQFIFEKPLEKAHSANADAVAALEIYLALQKG